MRQHTTLMVNKIIYIETMKIYKILLVKPRQKVYNAVMAFENFNEKKAKAEVSQTYLEYHQCCDFS